MVIRMRGLNFTSRILAAVTGTCWILASLPVLELTPKDRPKQPFISLEVLWRKCRGILGARVMPTLGEPLISSLFSQDTVVRTCWRCELARMGTDLSETKVQSPDGEERLTSWFGAPVGSTWLCSWKELSVYVDLCVGSSSLWRRAGESRSPGTARLLQGPA